MAGIRAATAGDYDAFVVLTRELGVDDPTPTEQRFANHLVPRMLVYERQRVMIGYVTYEKLADSGYIRNLVVAPQARGAGIGTALMRAAAEALRARGVTDEWQLNVKADNAPALRLYERLGFKPTYTSVAVRFPWANLGLLPIDPAPVTVRPVADAAVPDIERALGMVPGRLELSRSRGIGVTLQLRDAKLAPVGVACFDPAFPGAFPFCVARPTLASALLDGIAPHVHTGTHDLQIVVEHDDALADTLIAAGATVRMRLLRLVGPIPELPADEPPAVRPTPG